MLLTVLFSSESSTAMERIYLSKGIYRVYLGHTLAYRSQSFNTHPDGFKLSVLLLFHMLKKVSNFCLHENISLPVVT